MVTLALIVKPTKKEAKLLDRCLGYVVDYVDEICITQAGDKPNQEVSDVIKKYKGHESFFKWEKDFAKARNFNFSQATKEFILWLDTDDVLKGAENLPSTIKEMKQGSVDAGVMDYLYDFDKYGNCVVKHRKTRILRNDGCVVWEGIIHEDFSSTRELNASYIKDIQVMHLTDNERIESAKYRNLEIARQSLKARPDDPRGYWLVANAYLALNQSEDALEYFKKFIPKSGSEMEVFIAYHRMAICYLNMGQRDKAVACALEEVITKPWFPDGYLMLGEIYIKTGEPRKAKEFLIQGLTKEVPEDEHIVWNPRDYDFNPLRLLSQAYFELSKPKEAKQCLEKCLEIYPKDKEIKRFMDAMDGAIKLDEHASELFDKFKDLKDNELKKELDKVSIELRSHPKICYLRNNRFIKKESSGKDLVIYCSQSAEEFNPDIIQKEGRGGSEEAVYHMSKRFHKMGWNVTVYASSGYKAKNYDGVWWKPFWEFNVRDRQDVLISWRNPRLFDIEEVNAAKKYVWLHDVMQEGEFTPKRLERIDKIFALSKAQRDLFPNIPDDKFIITGNGLDLDSLNIDEERNPYRLIFSSSYDRGLECLLGMFPEIKKKHPQAELHVFYGWHVWDACHINNPEMDAKKERIKELLKQPGVFEHGRVSQERILKEYAKSSIWAYPTEFFEISCLSAMKAQALGCIPVTTNVGALDETVQFGLKVDSRTIYEDKQAQQEWLEGILQLLEKPPTEKERSEMVKWARKQFNWDSISESWNELWK